MALCAAGAGCAAAGCVSRTLEIDSDPPGAAVWVNHRYVGQTPVRDLEFTHYGQYQVTLRHRGRRAVDATESLAPPWYERFPVDLVTDVLLPAHITDARRLEYKLEPATPRAAEEVLADAVAARARLRELAPSAPAPEPAVAPAPGSSAAPANEAGGGKNERPDLGEPDDLAEEAGGPPTRRAGDPGKPEGE